MNLEKSSFAAVLAGIGHVDQFEMIANAEALLPNIDGQIAGDTLTVVLCQHLAGQAAATIPGDLGNPYGIWTSVAQPDFTGKLHGDAFFTFLAEKIGDRADLKKKTLVIVAVGTESFQRAAMNGLASIFSHDVGDLTKAIGALGDGMMRLMKSDGGLAEPVALPVEFFSKPTSKRPPLFVHRPRLLLFHVPTLSDIDYAGLFPSLARELSGSDLRLLALCQKTGLHDDVHDETARLMFMDQRAIEERLGPPVDINVKAVDVLSGLPDHKLLLSCFGDLNFLTQFALRIGCCFDPDQASLLLGGMENPILPPGHCMSVKNSLDDVLTTDYHSVLFPTI